MEERIRPRLEEAGRLRRFGRGLAVILVLAALIAWRRHKAEKAALELALAAISAFAAQFFPRAFFWPERLWMPVARALEKANTALLLGLIYWLVVVPAALLKRLAPKSGSLGAASGTYWKSKKTSGAPPDYSKQY